jgi:hypothetical protein
VADATVLRLQWGDAVETLVARVRQRRLLAPAAPLLLSLDRLDAKRLQWRDAGAKPPFAASWFDEYAETVRALAAAGRPEWFDVLPEVDVYLHRYPDAAPRIRELMVRLVQAVREGSPGTRVVLSFNAELLAGRYSRGDYRPFGILDLPSLLRPAQLAELAALADAVGLTTYPQSGYVDPGQMPLEHLTGAARPFAPKPVLITRAGIAVDERSGLPLALQAGWVQRLLLSCYWLDAPVVAYPDLAAERADTEPGQVALRVGETERKALLPWKEVFAWKIIHPGDRRRSTDGEEEAPPQGAR